MGEETTTNSKHTKKNQSDPRSFRDDRYPCIWRWNMCSSMWSQTTAIWNQTKINLKQIKIVKEPINNLKTVISSRTDGSKFSK